MTTITDFLPPHIAPISADDAFARAVDAELDAKTKPLGALGELERLAARIARIQQRIAPSIAHAEALVFAADHGVAAEGVSAFPQAVTAQMVANFLGGGAAICVLARAHGARLRVVDAGVAADLAPHPALITRSLGRGTANFVHAPAMTAAQCTAALNEGVTLGMTLPEHGVPDFDVPNSGVLVLGEMGIANTTSAAALMHGLTGTPIADCVGRGTGVDDAGIARKCAAINAAVARHGSSGTPLQLLARYGGFEIAMMAGAMLGAASMRQVILIDGFIATAAIAVAARITPAALDYCVFGHVSAEAPHRHWLKLLDARPLLDLGMRLGEGSGAMLALPLLRAACAILGEMATFQSAGVSGRETAEAAM
jgi:nicotinate-nucleotide--dimethylbenzimidazole phosphoribosyltransferase